MRANTNLTKAAISLHHPLLLVFTSMLKPTPRRGAKIIATLGPSTWTPEGMSRLLAADVDVVRFNVKHQTPAANQMLLDMWRAAAEQDWQGQQERLGLRGLVAPAASPVGIMVSVRLLSGFASCTVET
jgi:hypothetical protein